VSEKAHKKLIATKEKFKQLCEKAIGAGKQNSEEDFKQEIAEKEAALKAIVAKNNNIEQSKITKQKHHEKEMDKLSKEIADIESQKEDLIKVYIKIENCSK
jgi:DNA repair exonuclease SbcCD ATPase subunit